MFKVQNVKHEEANCLDFTESLNIQLSIFLLFSKTYVPSRYYLRKDGVCVMRMVDAEFEYTYEYQGNAAKLVHTPLTDKCYLTLTQGTLQWDVVLKMWEQTSCSEVAMSLVPQACRWVSVAIRTDLRGQGKRSL